MKKALIIAPHLDDEALGCGGTIAALSADGTEVRVCFVAHRIYEHTYDAAKMQVELAHAEAARETLGYSRFDFLDLPDERLDTAIQEIIIPLEKIVDSFKPELVFSPFPGDNNQDHRAVAAAASVVLRPSHATFVEKWLFYETPSCTEQTPNTGNAVFAPTAYFNVSKYFDAKLDAVACYETEARAYPNPRAPEGLRALAMKRGIEAGMELSEAFIPARMKLFKGKTCPTS
jgi:LmbE family N-acetylglucosaminyl deacetylase